MLDLATGNLVPLGVDPWPSLSETVGSDAAGDYLAGPNHVLPTSGCARYASPLGVYDFVKHISVIRWSREDLAAHWRDIARLAEVEGLDAHGRSVAIRFRDGGGGDE